MSNQSSLWASRDDQIKNYVEGLSNAGAYPRQFSITYFPLSKEACNSVKKVAEQENWAGDLNWAATSNGRREAPKPLAEYDTDHLENILITQVQLHPSYRAAILTELKKRMGSVDTPISTAHPVVQQNDQLRREINRLRQQIVNANLNSSTATVAETPQSVEMDIRLEAAQNEVNRLRQQIVAGHISAEQQLADSVREEVLANEVNRLRQQCLDLALGQDIRVDVLNEMVQNKEKELKELNTKLKGEELNRYHQRQELIGVNRELQVANEQLQTANGLFNSERNMRLSAESRCKNIEKELGRLSDELVGLKLNQQDKEATEPRAAQEFAGFYRVGTTSDVVSSNPPKKEGVFKRIWNGTL